MPLFSYQCEGCEVVVELFLHNRDDEVEIECEECGGTEFVKVFGVFVNAIRYNAKETMDKVINPEVDRIRTKVSRGSDKDFLDIAGD